MAWRLIAMKFFSYIGLLASYFVGILGTLTYALGGDALSTTVAVGSLNLTLVLASLVSGSLLDVVGPRRHFALCVSAICIAGVSFQFLATSVHGVLVASVIFGCAMGLCDVVSRSYPAYLTDDTAQLKQVNAMLSLVGNTGVIVGPAIGGAVASIVSPQAVPLFAAASAVVALIPAAGFRPARDPHAVAGKPVKDEASIVAGCRAVMTSPALRLLFAVGFFASFGYGAFDPLESLFYRDVLHVGVVWMGWLSSASGVGAVLGALLVARLPSRLVNLRTLMWALAGMGVGCLIYVGTPYVLVALAGQIALGVGFGALTPLQNTLVQSHAPLGVMGRVGAVMGFGFSMAGVVPLLFAPTLADILGVQGTLLAASACVTCVPLLCMLFLRRRIDAAVQKERSGGLSVKGE